MSEEKKPAVDEKKLTCENAQRAMRAAIDCLFLEQPALLHDVNERSVTHRLAVYLENEIRKLCEHDLDAKPQEVFADCEYNRDGIEGRSKTLEELRLKATASLEARLAKGMADDKAEQKFLEDLVGLLVYPDIIVHKRGKDGPNLIVVEAKRAGQDTSFDEEKLDAYTKDLNYEHAFLVVLGNDAGSTTPLCRNHY